MNAKQLWEELKKLYSLVDVKYTPMNNIYNCLVEKGLYDQVLENALDIAREMLVENNYNGHICDGWFHTLWTMQAKNNDMKDIAAKNKTIYDKEKWIVLTRQMIHVTKERK